MCNKENGTDSNCNNCHGDIHSDKDSPNDEILAELKILKDILLRLMAAVRLLPVINTDAIGSFAIPEYETTEERPGNP